MDIIRDYLEMKFADLPQTPKTKKAKEKILIKMEQRYEALIATGKKENEAIGDVISEYGAIDDLLVEVNVQRHNDQEMNRNSITINEAKSFFKSTKKLALAVAGGILSIAIGIGLMIVAINTAVYWVGVLLMLLLLIVGVSSFIIGGLAYGRSKQSLDERLIDSKTKTMAREQQQDYTGTFTILLVMGVGLCIFSLFPLIIRAIQNVSGYEYIGSAAFVWIIGSGLFSIVYAGIVYNGFSRILRDKVFYAQDDAAERDLRKLKRKNPRLHFFLDQIYWPVIVVSYFIISFYFNWWTFSWLIFIIGGILFGVIRNFAFFNSKVD